MFSAFLNIFLQGLSAYISDSDSDKEGEQELASESEAVVEPATKPDSGETYQKAENPSFIMPSVGTERGQSIELLISSYFDYAY